MAHTMIGNSKVMLLTLALLFVSIVAVSAATNLLPVAQCWRSYTAPGGSNIVTIYFGYVNENDNVVIKNPGDDNTFAGPHGNPAVPPSTFYPGMNGLAVEVTLTPSVAEPGENLQWYLSNYMASVNWSSPDQQCSASQSIQVSVALNGTSGNWDQNAFVQAFANAGSIPVANIAATMAGDGKEITVVVSWFATVENSTQYEAVYELVNNVNNTISTLQLSVTDTINAIRVGGLPGDQPGLPLGPVAPVPIAPVDPSILPIAHCWEPSVNSSDGNIDLYFGYFSGFTDPITIESSQTDNYFLGAPTGVFPVPVFYNGPNGFVSHVTVPAGTAVEWIVNGSSVVLDGSNVNRACNVNPDGGALAAVATWLTGNYTDSQIPDAIDALSDASYLPTSSIAADFTRTNPGFTIYFQLSSGNNISAYHAMYRTVNNFWLADSSLQQLWNDTFGETADSYSSTGTDQDVPGSPAAISNGTNLIPIAHCWVNSAAAGVKIGYFGYQSTYNQAISELAGPGNYIQNGQQFITPSVFRPNFNGFAVSLEVSSNDFTQGTSAWNLKGNTVPLNFGSDTLQCDNNAIVSFLIQYVDNTIDGFDQTAASAQIISIVSQTTTYNASLISLTWDQDIGSFEASVTFQTDPTQPGMQYGAVFRMVSSFNNAENSPLRNRLSAAVNGTAAALTASGTNSDVTGTAGTSSLEPKSYGDNFVTPTRACWSTSGNGADFFFGYTSTAQLDIHVPKVSSFVTGPAGLAANLPIVFAPGTNPYSAHVRTTSTGAVTWNLWGLPVSLDPLDITTQCNSRTSAGVSLWFTARLTAAPPKEGILNYISNSTGFPYNSLSAEWIFDSRSDFSLYVTFNAQISTFKAQIATSTPVPVVAAASLVLSLQNNIKAAAAISDAAGAHLYGVQGSSAAPTPIPAVFVPIPVDPVPVSPPAGPVPQAAPGAPIAPPTQAPTAQPTIAPTIAPQPLIPEPVPVNPVAPPSTKHKLKGGYVFLIVLGALAIVSIFGGALFYFLRYQKNFCKPTPERRPLLAE